MRFDGTGTPGGRCFQVLVSDPDPTWSKEIARHLAEHGYAADLGSDGKDCQLRAYRKEYRTLVLDIDTKDHSGLEVLRYMHHSHPRVKIVLTFSGPERFKRLDADEEELRRLGAAQVLIKPYTLDELLHAVEGENQLEAWRKLDAPAGVPRADEEVLVSDGEFTRIRIEAFHSGKTTVFDHYVRVAQDKFVKILHKGDAFDEARLRRYVDDKKVEYLYFRTKDRAAYVNFMNQALEGMVGDDGVPVTQKFRTAKTAAEKYLEEVHAFGLKDSLVEEGKRLAQNMFNLVQKDKNLCEYMRQLGGEGDGPELEHPFFVSFFSIVICKNLDWASPRTVEHIALAGLLHDIGILRLPPELRGGPAGLSEPQLLQFQLHPKLGAEMLQQSAELSTAVAQIVYQHHEWVNGGGYPNGLTAAKIYPLAKIVALADGFCDFLSERHLRPLDGLREFIPNKDLVSRYDPLAIKALVTGFMKGK